MRRLSLLALILAVALGSYLLGTWRAQRQAGSTSLSGRRIAYYYDPMHPAYKSDKPGIAPDCGMQLEPAYEGEEPTRPSLKPDLRPGTVRVSADKQQLIGVRVLEVKDASGSQFIRLPGRVASDERRIFFLNAATDGWIQETFPNSTGSLVKKDEVLATCYAPEFQAAEQAYFYALNTLDRLKASGRETPEQIAMTQASIKQAADGLRNLGMGDVQIQALARDRRITQNIELRSPANGFVLERNVAPGLRFERGKQLYRIADLSRIWVLADAFENQARFIKPGRPARVLYQGRSMQARMSDVLPQFDPATRTLKIRLELDNSSYVLRPDMFVDVEFPVSLPAGITVPADAIIDSGEKKTVFVERENGVFEPRTVQTAWSLGGQVGVTQGLAPGERVVVSGNFLIDSESRMQLADTKRTPTAGTAQDPVCGMQVDTAKAIKYEWNGKTYYFCAKDCKEEFIRNNAKNSEQAAKTHLGARIRLDGRDLAVPPTAAR